MQSNLISRAAALIAALALTLSAALAVAQNEAVAPDKKAAKPRPKMDVVFVLDTTGSMSGLIETAKAKIWAISNEILRGKPTPELRIGLVAYRDKKDQYVTRLYPLTGDLDAVHRNLMGFRAGGGGDTPEHVSKALHESVHGMGWSEAEGAIKIIFLVGDAPPHTDYGDGFDYRKAAREAIARGIMINTLRIGGIGGTERVWREIAKLADGSYNHIKVKQVRPVPVVKTEYDERLVALRLKLGKSTLGPTMASAPGGAPSAPAESSFGRRMEHGDLGLRAGRAPDVIDDIIAGRVKIDAVPEARLSPELKKLEGAARCERLAKLVAERKVLTAELKVLEAKRSAKVATETAKRARESKVSSSADSFDRVVVEAVKKAAGKKGIKYDEPEKKAPAKEEGEPEGAKKAPEGKKSGG